MQIELLDYAVTHAAPDGGTSRTLGPLTLSIAPGERVLLLGPSGVGKSTLLAALAGILTDPEVDDGVAEEGRILVGGRHPSQTRGHAGLMHQDPESQVVMATVERDVAFGPENLAVPPAEIRVRIPQALAAVGLGDGAAEPLALTRSTGQLSGGQKQRLGLAGLVAMQPGLLLLDEPTANLDPAGASEVVAAVDAVSRESGAGFIVVEHRIDAWARIVDRVIVLAPGGGLLADGPLSVLDDDAVRTHLRSAGVWLPGEGPRVDAHPRPAAGDVVLAARDLAVTRDPRRRWALRRGGSTSRRVIQSGFALELRRGEAVAIMGPNGAGKSTVALTLAGLLEPLAGTVDWAGSSSSPVEWRAPTLISRIGTVFQNPEHQFVTRSVRSELEHGPRLAGMPEDEIAARVDELLARLGLADRADQQPFTLSGGQKRRLSVASALAAAPEVLIVDEPTFGQDAVTWGELAALFNELLADGVAVVAVTHDSAFVEAIGARVVELAPQPRVQTEGNS
jgi:energy-coupling factor transport system ATP-binding protein